MRRAVVTFLLIVFVLLSACQPRQTNSGMQIIATTSIVGDAVLVGETLMRSAFPEDVLAELTGVKKRPKR